MNKGGLFLFIFMFLLINISLINAQPPFAEEGGSTFINGYFVEFTPLGVYENNQHILFNAHVYNISNGVRIGLDDADCFFHLFDNRGEHILNQINMSYDPIGKDWEYNTTKGNFTRNGDHSYLITCEARDMSLGGFVAVEFAVTQTGFSLETSESILYIIILLATFLLFLGFLYPAITLPYSNKVEPDGSIRRITKAKYLKLLSIWFAYGFLMWFLQTLNSVSKSFISLDYLSNFITNIFTYSQLFSVAVTFLILTILFIEVWKDIILSETIKRYGKALVNGDLK